MTEGYREFLEAKVRLDHACGFEIDPSEIDPRLADFMALECA